MYYVLYIYILCIILYILSKRVNMIFLDARKTCCALIDLVANGLKYALIVTESEYEKIKAIEQDEDKEPRIQELYRNKCEENTKNHGQRYINKIDFGDSNYKSVRSVIFLYRSLLCYMDILFIKSIYKRTIYAPCIENSFII